ncbi:hypothetical protein EPO04_00770 [Patescibacteria group bacterium]|nr:MAG: hypothetical protein EPO04_00770 [Patescibacteria group bacterium]
MKEYLQTMWWLLLLRGIFLILLGFFAVVWPGLTLYSFALGFALYLVLAGIVNAISSLMGIGKLPLWFLWLVVAILEIGVGVYALKHLTLTVATMILLVGLVFVVRGLMELISAFGDGFDGKQRTLYALLGVLSLIAGVAVWLYPVAGGLAFTWIIGLYGIAAGAFLIAMAIEAKGELNKLAA